MMTKNDHGNFAVGTISVGNKTAEPGCGVSNTPMSGVRQVKRMKWPQAHNTSFEARPNLARRKFFIRV